MQYVCGAMSKRDLERNLTWNVCIRNVFILFSHSHIYWMWTRIMFVREWNTRARKTHTRKERNKLRAMFGEELTYTNITTKLRRKQNHMCTLRCELLKENNWMTSESIIIRWVGLRENSSFSSMTMFVEKHTS